MPIFAQVQTRERVSRKYHVMQSTSVRCIIIPVATSKEGFFRFGLTTRGDRFFSLIDPRCCRGPETATD